MRQRSLAALAIVLALLAIWAPWDAGDAPPHLDEESVAGKPGSGGLRGSRPAPGQHEPDEGGDDDEHPLSYDLPRDPEAGRWRAPIEVRVVSAQNGAALEGALVRVRYDKPESVPADAADVPTEQERRTGSDGRAHIPYPTAYYAVAWQVRMRGFQTVWPEIGPRESPFEVQLTPLPPLGVRVVDGEKREPVVGARVGARAIDAPWEAIDDELVCDEHGRCELAGVKTGAPIEIAVVADGLATVVARHFPSDDRREPFEIVMGAGAEVVGVVQDPKGKPVAGAEVFLAEQGRPTPLRDGDRWDGPVRAFRRTRTHADGAGRFLVRGVAAPGTYLVYARAPAGAEGVSAAVAVPAVGGRHEAIVTLRRLGAITIRYVDAVSGERIDPDEVRCSMDADWTEHRPDQVPHDDAAAMVARLTDVAPGRHVLYLSARYHLERKVECELAEGAHLEVRVELERGRTVTGRTVDRQGNPVSVYVTFAADYNGIEQYPNARSGKDGRFALPAVPPAVGELSAFDDAVGRSTWSGIQPRGDLGDLVVGLHSTRVTGTLPANYPTGRVHGGVVDATGGGHTGGVHTEKDGRFVVELHAADRTVHVFLDVPDVPGIAPLVLRDVRVKAGEELDVGAVRFPAALAVEGRVLAHDGHPVARTKVQIAEFWGPDAVRTDATGGFRLERMPPGRSTLWIEPSSNSAHFQPVDVRPGLGPIEVRLPEPGRLRCKVVDEKGQPLGNAPLNLYPILDTGVRDWLRRVIVRTNSAGLAELPLYPGKYGVAVHASARRDMVDDPPTFLIKPGATKQVEIVVE